MPSSSTRGCLSGTPVVRNRSALRTTASKYCSAHSFVGHVKSAQKLQRCCSMGNGNGSTGIRPTTDTIDIENETVIPVAGARRLQVTGTAADGTTLTSRVRIWALLSYCFCLLVCTERAHLIRDLQKAIFISSLQTSSRLRQLPVRQDHVQNLATLTVRDMMVSPAFSLSPETEATEAMAFLVKHGLSGVPVTSADGKVLGVVSGYDLLALDCTPGKLDRSFFPPINTCINEFGGDRKMMWSNFKQLRESLKKADGKTVEEAMHRAFTISPDAPMEDCADMVVRKRAHRICVVDSEGALIGVVSRGDIMRATIATFQAYMDKQDAKNVSQQAASPSS